MILGAALLILGLTILIVGAELLTRGGAALGSFAEEALRTLDCDVLAVPPAAP